MDHTAHPRRFRRTKTLGVLAALVLSTATGCASEESDRVTLTFSDGFSPTHPIGKGGAQPFLNYLRQHGPDVGLDVEYFAAGQLGKTKDALHLLRSDAVQIAPVIPAYLANELPLSSVGELPGLVEDTCAATEALMPMVQPGGVLFDHELKQQGVVPLWGVAISGYEVFTADKPVTHPDDLRGSLIRSFGGVGDRLVKGLGAEPVQIAGPEIYEAIARKTVTGAVLTRISVKPYSLDEVIGFSTAGANLSATTVLYSVGAEVWDRLDEPQKNVLTEASALAQRSACEGLAADNEAALDLMREAGMTVTEIDARNRQDWTDALTPIRQQWVDDLESVGLPADAVLNEFERRLAGDVR